MTLGTRQPLAFSVGCACVLLISCAAQRDTTDAKHPLGIDEVFEKGIVDPVRQARGSEFSDAVRRALVPYRLELSYCIEFHQAKKRWPKHFAELLTFVRATNGFMQLPEAEYRLRKDGGLDVDFSTSRPIGIPEPITLHASD